VQNITLQRLTFMYLYIDICYSVFREDRAQLNLVLFLDVQRKSEQVCPTQASAESLRHVHGNSSLLF
jgi:hypothetical protein